MSGEPRQCIVPYPPTGLQKEFVWGRPPPYIKDWADMMYGADPLDLMAAGIGHTEGPHMQRYVDMSTLNNRERYAFLAGVGSIGGGTLAGSSLGNTQGLGATPPWQVCTWMQYECQHWNEYDAATQGQIIEAAKKAQAAYDATVGGARAGAKAHGEAATDATMLATSEASAAVGASQAAYIAAEHCDEPTMLQMIYESDRHQQYAEDHVAVAGQEASDAYAIAGKFPSDQTVVAYAEAAGGQAATGAAAVKNSEDVRQGAIAAAREKLKQCGGAPPPPPDEEEEIPTTKKGTARAGLLWAGLILLGTAGAYALSRKKKRGG